MSTMKKWLAAGCVWVVAWAWARGADFHVTTAQELQNALTLAAANGAADNIYLAAGYYTGNFNFNSAEAFALTIQGEAGTDRTQITIDGAGTGRSLALSCSAAANITVSGITVLRNCGGGGECRIAHRHHRGGYPVAGMPIPFARRHGWHGYRSDLRAGCHHPRLRGHGEWTR